MGTGYTTPVFTTNAFRYRNTGWQNSPYTYAPLSSAPPAGTYDIEVVNLSSGSHLDGLGLYTPTINIGSGPAVIQDNDLSYANGGKSFIPSDHPSGTGTYADNQFRGGDWFDYEVFNAGEAKTCIFTAHARQNMGFPVNVNVKFVDADGDVATVFASATVANTGWARTEFFDYASGTFTLPKGYSVIRVNSDEPLHLDSFTITEASTQTPLTYSGLVIVPATPTEPANLTATVMGDTVRNGAAASLHGSCTIECMDNHSYLQFKFRRASYRYHHSSHRSCWGKP